MQVNSELEPPQPWVPAATTPNLATNQKFGYCKSLPRRTGIIGMSRVHWADSKDLHYHFSFLCLFETYCTTCGAVLNAILSCDRIDEEDAGNAPFIVVCTNHGQIRRYGEVLFFWLADLSLIFTCTGTIIYFEGLFIVTLVSRTVVTSVLWDGVGGDPCLRCVHMVVDFEKAIT